VSLVRYFAVDDRSLCWGLQAITVCGAVAGAAEYDRLSAARNFRRDGLAISVLSARNEGQQAVIEAAGIPDLCYQLCQSCGDG
jgi:hypothetical protein